MRSVSVVLSVIFLFNVFTVNAQSKAAIKYREESEELRKNVWAWQKPAFAIKDIPAQFASASKVIIAQHTELNVASKSKMEHYGLLAFRSKKEQTITEVKRMMIKLNDKKALEDYSELGFKQFEKRSSLYKKDGTTIYVGVRIIKPDGTIREIDADEIVLTKDEKKEKEARLAIPDLLTGDIIDFFVATEEVITNDYSIHPYNIVLFDEAPVLYSSFHGELGKGYAVKYRSYNGAPELSVSTNKDDNVVIDLEQHNLVPFEPAQWMAPALQLPFIRLFYGSEVMPWRLAPWRAIYKEPHYNEIRESFILTLARNYLYPFAANELKPYKKTVEEAKKKARQMGVDYEAMNDEDKAALLFYTFRFEKMMDLDVEDLPGKMDIGHYRSADDLYLPLVLTFKTAGLDPVFFISNKRLGYRLREAMWGDDFAVVPYLPSVGKFFSIESPFDLPFQTPEVIEGVTEGVNCRIKNKKGGMTHVEFYHCYEFDTVQTTPVSLADNNVRIENLSLSLSATKDNLAIKRSTLLRGHYKADIQKELVTFEDYYEFERMAFKEEMSLLETLRESRKGKKVVDEITNAFAAQREKQKEAFIKEVKDWFEQDISDLKDYKTDNPGIRHTAPDFIYSSTFTMDGILKKAGNNIIVEVGKLQGHPLTIKSEQRNRSFDIYMPFARTIEYNIEFNIPEGYTAEGSDALNRNVENETGLFAVKAAATDSVVLLKIKKVYANNFEPAQNWNKLLQFIDASADFVNAKFLLKKK